MKTPPVLFIIFRRPDTTARVFEAIRQARPSQLFIAADGPRTEGEAEQCEITRKVVENVDWPCEVVTRFQSTNLGLKIGVSSAITWFFSQVNEGIILEDDCLPHPDFFSYCATMLATYRDDPRVFHVGGVNFQRQIWTKSNSYYFSRYNHVWGWASWKRAWDFYSAELDGLEEFLSQADATGFWDSSKERTYWRKIFRATQLGTIKTWDYQWKYTMWAHYGFSITPEANLVVNIGFVAEATNTFEKAPSRKERALEPLPTVEPNRWMFRQCPADRHTFQKRYWGSFGSRLVHRIRKLMRLRFS